jgi:hypothetical protein
MGDKYAKAVDSCPTFLDAEETYQFGVTPTANDDATVAVAFIENILKFLDDISA